MLSNIVPIFQISETGIIIQRNWYNSQVDFDRNWETYKAGFGNSDGYWRGFEEIHTLTQTGLYYLNISLEAMDGELSYAVYNTFVVDSEGLNYRLTV